jgi:hypothetical protein
VLVISPSSEVLIVQNPFIRLRQKAALYLLDMKFVVSGVGQLQVSKELITMQ